MRRRDLLTGSAALGLSAGGAHAFGIGRLGTGEGHLGALGGAQQPQPNITQRAPLATDDVNSGYLQAGMIGILDLGVAGSAYTSAPSAALTAPPTGVAPSVTPFLNGTVVNGAFAKNTTGVYTVAPTVTLSGGGGTGATMFAALSQGSLWGKANAGNASTVYKNTSALAGAATWTVVSTATLPGDTVMTPTSCGGTIKLVAAYSGPCLQLTRASDLTTLDIGFIAGLNGNSVVDAASADAFCNGTTGYVTTWYDQSGNGCHQTQPSIYHAPVWNTNTINGYRCVSFSSQPTGIWSLLNATIASGGTGYVSGDVGKTVSIVGGAGTLATVTITSVNAGAVSGFTIANPGNYTGMPTAVPATTTGGGTTGTGLTLTLDFSLIFMSATVPSYTYQDSACILVGQAQGSGVGATNVMAAFGSTANSMGTFSPSGIPCLSLGAQGTIPVPTSPCCISYIGNTGGGTKILNVDNSVSVLGVGGTTTATTVGIGCGDLTNQGRAGSHHDYLAWMFYGSNSTTSPTPAQELLIRASLTSWLQLTPQVNDIVVFDGDSIDFGWKIPTMQTYARQATPLLNKPVKVYNTGIVGDLLSNKVTTFVPHITRIYAGMMSNTSAKFIVLQEAATNDLANSVPATTCETNIQSFGGLVHGLGGNAKFVACSPPQRGDVSGGILAQFQAYWAYLPANYQTFADGFGDIANNPNLQDPTDTTKFVDLLHLTQLGDSFVAQTVAPPINALLR